MRGRVLLTLFFFATTDLKLRITITSFNRRGWLRKYVLILTKRNAWPTKLYRKNFHFSIFKHSYWYQAIIRNLKPLFVLCILVQKHLLKNMISDFKKRESATWTNSLSLFYKQRLWATVIATSWNFGKNKQQPVQIKNILSNSTHFFPKNAYQKRLWYSLIYIFMWYNSKVFKRCILYCSFQP